MQHGYLYKQTPILIPAGCVVQDCARAADKMHPDKDLKVRFIPPHTIGSALPAYALRGVPLSRIEMMHGGGEQQSRFRLWQMGSASHRGLLKEEMC